MRKLCILMLLVFMTYTSHAQTTTTENVDDTAQNELVYQSKKNIVKFNFTSLAFKNFQFNYERVLNKTFSVALSYAFIPDGDIPLKSTVEKYADDPDLMTIINDAQLSYSSFTPEVRIYLGKGYGKGFYLAPFFRSSKYTFKDVNFEYDTDGGGTAFLTSQGTIKSNSFGLLLGAQFNLGKNFVLDWWIVGPHYGSSNGDISGITSETLSQMEQQDLENTLNDIDIPLVDTEVEVFDNGANLLIDGPWAGIRAGLSIGFRF